MKKITYNEALNFINDDLNKVDNLKLFCKNNDLSYQAIRAIKNRKDEKEYPLQLIKVMNVLGYEVKTETFFIVK